MIFSRLIFAIILLMAVFSCEAKVTAQSWLVADGDGRIIQSENTNEVRSIASITKLMTAMVILDAKQDLDEKIGQYTRGELIQLAIVHSDNQAAKNLCQYYTHGYNMCVTMMNRKAYSLGLSQTKFTDSTGLGVFNVSTAEELVTLVREAQNYPLIVESSKMSQVKIKVKKKWLIFNNTNPIIGKRHDFIVSKTGYIRASGGCIVMMLDTDIGRRIVVVLGSKSTKTRIPEAEFLAKI